MKDKHSDCEIYWLYYENLVQDEDVKRKEIKNLIEFIGVNDNVGSKEDIDKIIHGSNIDKMKQQFTGFFVKDFVREGGIGNWKKHLSDEQSEIMDALMKVHFNGTDFKYYNELTTVSASD